MVVDRRGSAVIKAIKDFFVISMLPAADEETSTSDDDIRLAACALLLEIAYADDQFSNEERQHLELELGRRFELEAADTTRLIALAQEERQDSVDLWQFTRLITEHYSTSQKMMLLEIMWGLAHSDGILEDREVYIMRKICNLLRLDPGYVAEARQRYLRKD